ncbi:MAG: hypothetical protein ACLUS5_12425 [Roseburia faecis]|jgi:hypothetical protein|nr:MAG TPA: ECL1/2/3 zinc binding protein [Caudoviricetes sp.]
MAKVVKKCVVCGKKFYCESSRNIVTCSRECRLIHLSQTHKGLKRSEESKRRMSEARLKNPRNMEIQRKATEAAKKSPKSGRFETNRAAIDWHLVSPEGEHFYIHSLSFWLRENGNKYFGVEPDTKQFFNIIAGLSRVKRSVLGILPEGQRPGYSYKGWHVIPTDYDKKNKSSIR